MSPTLRFVLAALACFGVASSALGSQVSVSTFATSTEFGGVTLFSDGATSVGPFGPPLPPPWAPSSLTVAASGPACPTPPCFTDWAGSGAASADLAAGTLGTFVSGWHGDAEIYGFVAQASFMDTLVFHLPPGTASTQVSISMTIDAVLPPQTVAPPRFLGDAFLLFGQDGPGLDLSALATSGSGPTVISHVLVATTTVLDGVPVDVQAMLQGSLTLQQTDHGGPYVFDALHTASLSISVPVGVTYDSLSGVFLTQVAEPPLHLLSSSALGVFAAVQHATRRRRMKR